MIRFGLFFASSRSSVAWRTGKCSPESVQDFSCSDLRATVRAFSGSSLAFFPPLLRSLFEGLNLALSIFMEDQTVHSFLPVPGRRCRRYYGTSSSFPGLYLVLPGLAPLTLESVSESWKHAVSLSRSLVSFWSPFSCVSRRGHLLAGLITVLLWGFLGSVSPTMCVAL